MEKLSLDLLVRKEEKKDIRKALIITLGIALLMTLFMLFWIASRGMIPPPGEKQYEAAGSIDFGDWNEGSQDINNFEDPSANAADAPPPAQSDPQPTDESAAPPIATETNDEITSETEEEVITHKDNPTPVEPVVKPREEKKEVKETKTEVTETKTDSPSDSDSKSTTDKSGSNHGDSQKVGDRGTPEAKTLDPNGLYNFGGGTGGLNGRIPVALPNPNYKVQQEAKLTFTFIIAPSGKVKRVIPPITTNPGLKKAGMDAIRKWKFNAVDPSVGDQTTKVTILFKLN